MKAGEEATVKQARFRCPGTIAVSAFVNLYALSMLGGMAMTALAVYNLIQYRKLLERNEVLPNGKKPVW